LNHIVHRYFIAHLAASFSVAIALITLQRGHPTCSDPVSDFVFAPLSVPAFLVAIPFMDLHSSFQLATAFTAYGTYFAILAAYLLFSRPPLRQRDENACLTCGYNLTGNTSGICPECGNAIVPNNLVERKP